MLCGVVWCGVVLGKTVQHFVCACERVKCLTKQRFNRSLINYYYLRENATENTKIIIYSDDIFLDANKVNVYDVHPNKFHNLNKIFWFVAGNFEMAYSLIINSLQRKKKNRMHPCDVSMLFILVIYSSLIGDNSGKKKIRLSAIFF